MSIPYRSESHRSITVQVRSDLPPMQEITSALDPLILTQDPDASLTNVERVDGGKSLHVSADVVRIRGPVVLPGRHVYICARVIEAEPDSKGRKATLDVSGAPGPAPASAAPKPAKKSAAAAGTNEVAFANNMWGAWSDKPGAEGEKKAQNGAEGKPGERGFNGGVMEIYCERVAEPLDLELIAVGGRGGKGQDGQPGQDGQDGGQGAEGTNPFGGFGLRHGTAGGNGGNGGDGGKGGRGGYGGNGGNITFWTNVQTGPLRHKKSAGAMGEPGNSGAGGETGTGGKGGTDYVAATALEMPVQNPATPINGKDGKSGSTPSRTVNGANDVAEGYFNQSVVGFDQLSRRSNAAHLAMMMQRIRWAYLAGHPELNKEGFAEAGRLLAWVLNMTKPFDKDWPKEDKKSYPDMRPLRDLNQLAAIHRQAKALAGQLALGLSYYGQPESYAPRTSLSFYQTYLHELIKSVESLETTSNKYFSELGETQKAQGTLRTAAGQTQSLVTSLNEDKKRLQSRLGELQGAIETAHAEVLKQEKVVSEKLATLQAKISSLNDLSATDLVKVLSSVTVPSSPTDFKAIGETIKEVGGAVKDVYDKGKLTQYKINRLDVLGQGAKSLKEAYGYSKGYITESDPHAYKLIASKTLLDKEMEKYYGVVESDEVSAAMRTLVDRVQERNDMILTYNGARAHADAIGEQIAHAVEQQALVEEALAANSRPDLPAFAAFVDGLYQKSKDQLIRQLYMASRAYAFWALEDYALFYKLLGLSQPSTINASVLRAAKTEILNAFANTVEDRGADPQLFPSKGELHKDPHARGLVVTLDAENFRRAFEELRAHKQAVFRLSAPRPPKSPRELQRPDETGESPFEGMSEVMATTVRVFLNGATTRSNVFKVGIQHGGVHEFVRSDGQVVVLTSNPVRRTFSYEYIQQGDKKVLNIKQDGNITEKDERTARYAPLSPFTWWRIEVDPVYNPGLDLSKLTSVEIEFHGNSYPFNV